MFRWQKARAKSASRHIHAAWIGYYFNSSSDRRRHIARQLCLLSETATPCPTPYLRRRQRAMLGHCLLINATFTLWRPLSPYGYSIKHPVPDRVKQYVIIFDIRALWRSTLSVRVPGPGDGLTRSGTGCFMLYPYGNSWRVEWLTSWRVYCQCKHSNSEWVVLFSAAWRTAYSQSEPTVWTQVHTFQFF